MASIKDVAKLASVSMSTVSLAINYPERVTEETKRRIFEAMKELHYIPTSSSKNKSNGSQEKKSVIVVTTGPSGSYHYDLLRGINETLDISNIEIIVVSYDNSTKKHILKLVSQKKFQGIILISVDEEFICDFIKIVGEDFPCVLFDTGKSKFNLSTINIDNYYIGELMANHLCHIGYTKIGIIGVKTYDRIPRYEGFLDTLKNNGIEVEKHWMIRGDMIQKDGYDGIKHLIESGNDLPEVFFCMNDELAIGAITALQQMGRSIPKDIAVTGCDNIAISRFCVPTITTVDIPVFEEGVMAVTLLLRRLAGKTPENIVLNGKLVIRDSCGYKIRQKQWKKIAKEYHNIKG